MSTSETASQGAVRLSAKLTEALTSSLSALGRFHNDEYIISPYCLQSVKEIMRFLRKDNESHEIRRYLGQAKVVQNDLIHIVKACSSETGDLFEFTVRLLTNLTGPVPLFFREEVPAEKIGRSIYMALTEHLQDYKEAFYDIDFWNVICGKLTDLFEIDWTERSEDDCLKIERMLVLVCNILRIPADPEREKITEDDISVHDKILWSLRQSQILEFLLYVSSNKSEERYYLHLLDIFSLILREQNPRFLAGSEVQRSAYERQREVKDLLALREKEKAHKKMYKHSRSFDSTLVLRGLKSFSGRDMIYHGSLSDVKESVVPRDKKRGKPRNRKSLIESGTVERRSSFSVRIFLKEFCVEFLNCSYNNLMNVAKEKLISGRALANDENIYFWALYFFLEFFCACNLDIKLISDSIHVQTFHFLQTHMQENFEKLFAEKKKAVAWVRKLHLILKAYHALLQTLKVMDSSKDASAREMSEVLKSQVFYVAEYREMALYFLTRYDSDVFSTSYLRDVVEAVHASVKLLEEYAKRNKVVVQKRIRRKVRRREKGGKNGGGKPGTGESNEEKWNRIKGDAERALAEVTDFPEVTPFDVLLDLTEDEQKRRAMRNVQKLLHEGRVVEGIGLLRSARQAWPENDHFGSDGMSPEDEMLAVREICLAEMGNGAASTDSPDEDEPGEEDEEELAADCGDEDLGDGYRIVEKSFDIMDYKKQLVNKKVVEACAVLLKSYSKNSDYTNHCAIKILFRIGWECLMPAMMYQASLFSTLLTVMNDKYRTYKEINDFAIHLFRKFRETAANDKSVFAELLFWKDSATALEIQGDFADEPGSNRTGGESGRRGRKAVGWSVEEEDELERLWRECAADWPLKRKMDWIKSNLIDDTKSLKAIRRKLGELGLIARAAHGGRSVPGGKEWLEEEVEEVTKLFHNFRDAVDVVNVISERLTLRRTKKSIRQKLLELRLVDSLSDLRKRRDKGGGRKVKDDGSCASDDGGNETKRERVAYSLPEQRKALKEAEHLKDALIWLKRNYEEFLEEQQGGGGEEEEEDGDEDEEEFQPLLATEKAHSEALKTEAFVNVLEKLGLEEPAAGGVFWKIPRGGIRDGQTIIDLLEDAIAGRLSASESDESEDEFDKLRRMTKARSNAVGKAGVGAEGDAGRKRPRSAEGDAGRKRSRSAEGSSSGDEAVIPTKGRIQAKRMRVLDSDDSDGDSDNRKSPPAGEGVDFSHSRLDSTSRD